MSEDGEPARKKRSDWNVQMAKQTMEYRIWSEDKFNIIAEWEKEAMGTYHMPGNRFRGSIIGETFTSLTSRGDSKWNARLANGFFHACEDFNAGRVLENPGKYSEWLPTAMATMRTTYHAMTDAEREAQLTEFTTRRDLQNKAALKDRKPGSGFSRSVAATGNRITRLIDDLNTNGGVEAIVILAPGDPHLPFTPMVHTTKTAKKFFKDVTITQKEPAVVAKMLEGYCASGLAEGLDLQVSMTKKTANKVRSDIRGGIQGGLDEIMIPILPEGVKPPQMNYTNLEGAIVEEHGVALVGWPLPNLPVTQPGKLSAGQVAKVKKALDDGTLRWVRLSEQELAERKIRNQMLQDAGNVVYVPRKPRAKKRNIAQVEA